MVSSSENIKYFNLTNSWDPKQVLTFRVKVDLRVMAVKVFFLYIPNAPDVELHHQMQCHIKNTCWGWGSCPFSKMKSGLFYSSSWLGRKWFKRTLFYGQWFFFKKWSSFNIVSKLLNVLIFFFLFFFLE